MVPPYKSLEDLYLPARNTSCSANLRNSTQVEHGASRSRPARKQPRRTGIARVYPLTEKLRNRGISSRNIFTWVQNALAATPHIPETLPAHLLERYNLMGQAKPYAPFITPITAALQRAANGLSSKSFFICNSTYSDTATGAQPPCRIPILTYRPLFSTISIRRCSPSPDRGSKKGASKNKGRRGFRQADEPPPAR